MRVRARRESEGESMRGREETQGNEKFLSKKIIHDEDFQKISLFGNKALVFLINIFPF